MHKTAKRLLLPPKHAADMCGEFYIVPSDGHPILSPWFHNQRQHRARFAGVPHLQHPDALLHKWCGTPFKRMFSPYGALGCLRLHAQRSSPDKTRRKKASSIFMRASKYFTLRPFSPAGSAVSTISSHRRRFSTYKFPGYGKGGIQPFDAAVTPN